MANPEHLAKLKEGVESWNRWRRENHVFTTDLSGVKLPRAILQGAHLSHADLSDACLDEAVLTDANLGFSNLTSASLQRANLRSVNLGGAELFFADLDESDLHGANLHAASLDSASLRFARMAGANLTWADLTRARLGGADFSDAEVGNTKFGETDLRNVIGLETVLHISPSSIGIDTIYKSKGKIPHVFLRGAGVPENFIEYMASLVGTGIEFYSLFISYSTKDQEFAERLHADLQAKDVRCWFAPHDMRSGKKVHEQIDQAIHLQDRLLLILSPDSIKSQWVKTEILKAHKREIKENRRVLYPISLCSFDALRDWECFDADTGMDLAREIREYFIPDFSNWKDHDSYRLAFDRLLDDLHGKPEPPSA
jgi:uncharacterized protein YjbI with pentapeptide repeats